MSRLVSLAVVLMAGLFAVSADVVRRPLEAAGASVKKDDAVFRFRLSEGAEETAPVVRAPAAVGTALDEAETRRVLDRLPAWSAPDDEHRFALREASLPPPRAGRTVREPFPPTATAARPEEHGDAGPLSILRRTPEGPVPLAPNLSVTFSEPMVAVTGHEDLAGLARPVRLRPEPPGHWRWVGTKTLLFEPAGRFPMASDYRVEVPAGTRSATGGTLATHAAWTFSTPPPSLIERHPADEPTRREPMLFAVFDQRIDREAVASRLRLQARGASFRVRVATDAEVEADKYVKALAAGAEAGRFLAFRPTQPLPVDAAVTVVLAAGTPSAEGPKTTAKDQSWSFQTFGPLQVVTHWCGWNDPCPPGGPWLVQLSNPIDPRAFRKEMVRVGLEPLNPALATTETLPGDTGTEVTVVGAQGLGGPRRPGSWWWWRRTWFEHQNLRDERVEAFTSLLWEGVYTYAYVARATTPGAFVVPPARAEEMYAPETFGRGATDRVVVQ